jgi:ankyrin repeat protein
LFLNLIFKEQAMTFLALFFWCTAVMAADDAPLDDEGLAYEHAQVRRTEQEEQGQKASAVAWRKFNTSLDGASKDVNKAINQALNNYASFTTHEHKQSAWPLILKTIDPDALDAKTAKRVAAEFKKWRSGQGMRRKRPVEEIVPLKGMATELAQWRKAMPDAFGDIPRSSAVATTAAATTAAKPVAGLDEDLPGQLQFPTKHTDAKLQVLVKTPDHNFGYAVELAALKDPEIAGRLAALEFDTDEAHDYVLMSPDTLVTPKIVEIMGKGFVFLHELKKGRSLKNREHEIILGLDKRMGAIPAQLLPDLIKVANYEGSPTLMAFFMVRYVDNLQASRKQSTRENNLVAKELARQKFIPDLLKELAKYYFLRTGDGIDREVGALLPAERVREKDTKTVAAGSATTAVGAKSESATTGVAKPKKFFVKIPYEVISKWREFGSRLANGWLWPIVEPNVVKNGNTALSFAIRNGTASDVANVARLPEVDIDLEFVSNPDTPDHKTSAIHYVDDHRGVATDKLMVLLDAGADTESRDSNGSTLLLVVSQVSSANYLAAVQVLIDAGANVNAYDRDGHTVWARAETPELQEILRKAGVREVSYVTQGDGVTPLHRAAEINDVKAMAELLDGGANINAQTSSGETPFFVAVMNRAWGAIELLIRHRADLNLASKMHKSPLFQALENRDMKLLDTLLAAGAKVAQNDIDYVQSKLQFERSADLIILERLEKYLKKEKS